MDSQSRGVWPEQRLIVETDGKAHHGTPRARARDRRRDERLEAAGWRVRRFRYERVAYDPAGVAREVVAELRSPGSSDRRRPLAA